VTNSYRLCGSLQANYSAEELRVLGSDPFASGEALNGGGTPILCDTGSGLDSSWLLTKTKPLKRIIPMTRK
jgi:hypothetical protein